MTGSQSQEVDRAKWLPLEPNPLLLEHACERAESVQNRIADQITAFAALAHAGDTALEVLARAAFGSVPDTEIVSS